MIRQSKNSQLDFQVTLVEGSPTIYEQLKSRFINEPTLAGRLTIIHGLVGERWGEARIVESDFHVMNSVVSGSSSVGINVPYVDLATLYANSEIDLLKCDIEGSELLFIENYQNLLRRVKRAVFELHHDKCSTNRCFDLLKDIGFLNHQQLRKESTSSLDFFWRN